MTGKSLLVQAPHSEFNRQRPVKFCDFGVLTLDVWRTARFYPIFQGNVYWKTLCVMVKNGKRHVQIVVSCNFIQLFHATNPTISKQLSLHFPGCTGSKAPGHVRWPQRPSNISRIAPLTNVFSSTKIFFLSKFQIPRAVGRIGRINIYQILSYTMIIIY